MDVWYIKNCEVCVCVCVRRGWRQDKVWKVKAEEGDEWARRRERNVEGMIDFDMIDEEKEEKKVEKSVWCRFICVQQSLC